jgi:hypothetical protein
MDSRPQSLPLHTYALNLTYGLVDVALFHRCLWIRARGPFLEVVVSSRYAATYAVIILTYKNSVLCRMAPDCRSVAVSW